MSPQVKQALERLLKIAAGSSGQCARVADFLLAWWNSETCGGFDLTSPWALDDSIVRDMATVFAYVANNAHYPDTLGYTRHFEGLVRIWRPELVKESA